MSAFNIKSQEYYYHASPIYLENRSVIKKGNWGRVLKQYMDKDCNGLNLFRERVLEDIRQKYFLSKPSRLNSVFLLLSIDEANIYRNLHCKTSLIYKVSISDFAAKAHLGNYNKVQPTPPDYHFDNMDRVAQEYWNGANVNDLFALTHKPVNHFIDQMQVHGLTTQVMTTTKELIVESDIEIIECLN